LSEEQFLAAIQGGIAKINVATDMFVSAGRHIAEKASRGEGDYFAFQTAAQEAFLQRCEYYLELFNKNHKL
jgi:fructose/tagatose bisphosphate aldolase